jgi:hypothetical protein
MECISMVRKMIRASMFSAMGVVAMLASYGVATSANAADVEIGEVMKKSFAKDGLKGKISTAVKGEKWEDAAKLAKEWNELSVALGKNKPPKGDPKSWEKLCGGFEEATKGVLAGAEKKDAKAVSKAMSTINCASCHKAHKGS